MKAMLAFFKRGLRRRSPDEDSSERHAKSSSKKGVQVCIHDQDLKKKSKLCIPIWKQPDGQRSSLSSNPPKGNQCPLLDQVPYEIRMLIYEYVFGSDVAYLVVSKARTAHVSLHSPAHPVETRVVRDRNLGSDEQQITFLPLMPSTYSIEVDKIQFSKGGVNRKTRLLTSYLNAINQQRFDHLVQELPPYLASILVFHCIWKTTAFSSTREVNVAHDGGTSVYHVKNTGVMRLCNRLALLKTCRQIYEEAYHMLYSQTNFAFQNNQIYRLLPGSFKYHQRALIRTMTICFDFNFVDDLLVLDWLTGAIKTYLPHIQTLTLSILFSADLRWKDSYDRAVLKEILQHLDGLRKAVPTLEICFAGISWQYANSVADDVISEILGWGSSRCSSTGSQ